MPANFDRFRVLNQSHLGGESGHPATSVAYAGYSDVNGTAQRLPPRSPVSAGKPLPQGAYVADVPPPGEQTVDIASLRVQQITMANGATLTNWLLPCPDANTKLSEVDIAIVCAPIAGNYIARAQLYFDTGTAQLLEQAVVVPPAASPPKGK